MTSKHIGIAGTWLSYLATALADFHVIATSPEVQIALTAVVGFLTAHHIISSAFGRQVEAAAGSDARRVASVVEAMVGALGAAGQTKPASTVSAASSEPTYRPPA